MAISIHHVDYDPLQHSLPPRRYAWTVFAIVFALMVVDYVDRQVVVSMFPYLKAQWTLSDGQLGGLVSIVSIMVALGTIPLSLLADRWSRVKSIFLMALVWSIATIACAYAQNYGHLLVARSIVGLGEAAYGSAGVALLATMFPARMRSTVLGAFLAAGLVGSVLGVVLGGVIVDALGLAGRIRRGGCTRSAARDSVHRRRPRLQNHCAANAAAKPSLDVDGGRRDRRPRCCSLVRHSSRASVPAFNSSWCRRHGRGCPATSTASTASHRIRPALKTGLVVLVGGIGAVVWSIVADRLSGRFRVPAFRFPRSARC